MKLSTTTIVSGVIVSLIALAAYDLFGRDLVAKAKAAF